MRQRCRMRRGKPALAQIGKRLPISFRPNQIRTRLRIWCRSIQPHQIGQRWPFSSAPIVLPNPSALTGLTAKTPVFQLLTTK